MKKLIILLFTMFAITVVNAQTSFITINEDNKAARISGVPAHTIVQDIVDVKSNTVLYTRVKIIDSDHYYQKIGDFYYMNFDFSSREEAINFFDGLYQFLLKQKPRGTIVDNYQGYTITISEKNHFYLHAPSTFTSNAEGFRGFRKASLDWIIKSLKM